MWHVGNCGVRVVGKMSKDIGTGVRKGTVVSFVPTLFGCFLGFHPYTSFHFLKCFFVTAMWERMVIGVHSSGGTKFI